MQVLPLFPEISPSNQPPAAPARELSDFERWWALYPRKIKRIAAQRAWNRLTRADRGQAAAALPRHVDYWRRRYGRDLQYIPHASTWLNGRRWEDELEPIVERQAAATGPGWWTSVTLMIRKAAEVGVGEPRPGEETAQYRARIQQAIDDRDRFGGAA